MAKTDFNIDSYDLLKDIYAVVDRMEVKIDKRMVDAECRLDRVEDFQSRILGAVSVVGLFVGGAVTWIWDRIRNG